MKVEKLTEAHDRSPFRCGRDELDEWFRTAAMQTQQRYRSAKTGRGRVLHLDEDTAAAIAARPCADNGRWPLVFTRPDGMPWRPEVVSDRWRRQWPALDLPKITLHALRHCHACLLLDQGVISTPPGLSRTRSWEVWVRRCCVVDGLSSACL